MGRKIYITGNHPELAQLFPQHDFIPLPILEFKRLAVERSTVLPWIEKPAEWIVFSSPRVIQFWNELLLENGLDFPIETQVACIGESTARAAELDGYTPDFFPTEAGTENFLKEFKELLVNVLTPTRVLIPASSKGRIKLSKELEAMGCDVFRFPLYEPLASPSIDLLLSQKPWSDEDTLLITSPSSLHVLLEKSGVRLPKQLISMGEFTSEAFKRFGIQNFKTLPGSDFSRLEECL